MASFNVYIGRSWDNLAGLKASGVTVGAHEYPTALTIIGGATTLESRFDYTRSVSLYLSNADKSVTQLITTFTIPSGSPTGDAPIWGTYSISSGEKFRNTSLYFYFDDPGIVVRLGDSDYLSGSITMATEYPVFFQVDPASGGSISADNVVDQGYYLPGVSFSAQANPASGYKFDHFEWNTKSNAVTDFQSSTLNPIHIQTQPDDLVVRAFFSVENYTISTTVNPTGAGAITAPSTGTPGQNISISQTPTQTQANYYKFKNWSVTGATLTGDNTESNNKFAMPQNNVSIVANYTKHAITWGTWNNTQAWSQNKYVLTFTRPATATDSFGWDLEYCLYKGSEMVDVFSGSTATYTMTATETTQGSLTFYISAKNTSSADHVIENKNSNAITVTPTAVGADTPTTSSYTIRKVVDPSGAGTISCRSSASSGTTVYLTQTPNDDYQFSRWSLSGATLKTSGTQTYFTMPASSVTVTAYYVGRNIVWDEGSSLSVKQNGYELTITLTGSANTTYDLPLSYHLYKGETKIGEFTDGTASCKITDDELNVGIMFMAVATDGTHSANGPSTTYAPFATNKTIGYFKDSKTIVETIPHYSQDGSSFIEVEAYYHTTDGAWVLCSMQ